MADANKTEQATPRHRKRARERGQVTRSRELSGALAMAAVAGVVWFLGHNAVPHWTLFFRNTLDSARTDNIEPNGPLLFWTSIEALRWIMPMLAAALGVALVSNLAQGGFVFAPDALSPKFERLSPANRLQQMVSLTAVSTILKSLLPFGAIAWVGYACVRSHWGDILLSSWRDAHGVTGLLSSMLLEITWKSGLVLLSWAGIDYLLLWRKNESDLKMSRQEIKDELKESDGNPQSKARIRKLQRHHRRRQMLKAAETATVVITNPTHYAVALRYEVNMAAPIMVAKGLDNLAAKIKQIAWDRDIPVMENKPLAQALYKGVEVGDPIPSALYHAVAEILVMVYKAQAEVRNREARRKAPITPIPQARPL
ncbi:MAG TPA: EscU/YscU/HrcU family type III secretion system export apparatus switch protein [Acidobacteriaceae bacterium]|jgi:flagellar biosynthetic protein FlhB|nr:EscU/YscU/HrcU family type III secretion system export apparatus switch protein [Acidobacteriaceae bacterium]